MIGPLKLKFLEVSPTEEFLEVANYLPQFPQKNDSNVELLISLFRFFYSGNSLTCYRQLVYPIAIAGSMEYCYSAMMRVILHMGVRINIRAPL